MMYLKNETDQSFAYLKKVVEFLDEPICILGGWAVYLTINNKYQEQLKREYLGSRDVDLDFHIEENATDFSKTAFRNAIKKLESEGFREINGKLCKPLDLATGIELTPEQAASKPMPDLNYMYIDLLTDNIPTKLKEETKMDILDESLLYYTFTNPTSREELEQFGKKLWLPKPWLLLTTKIKALPGRKQAHKRQKDIADIAGLLLFSREDGWEVVISQLHPRKEILLTLKGIKSDEIKQTENLLGVAEGAFRATLLDFIQKVDGLNILDYELAQNWEKKINVAIKKRNISSLITILEILRGKSSQLVFINKEFTQAIFNIFSQDIFYDPIGSKVLSELLSIIYNQWTNFQYPTELYLIQYKEPLGALLDKLELSDADELIALTLLLIVGKTTDIVNIIATRKEGNIQGHDQVLVMLGSFSITHIKNRINRKTLEQLNELIYQKLDNATNEKLKRRFAALLKAIQ